jgi:hypothetical protein
VLNLNIFINRPNLTQRDSLATFLFRFLLLHHYRPMNGRDFT